MSQTILLAEDNDDNRTIYRTILEHVGYAVLEATDGEAAVRVATESIPDLILMDISMPRLDGWQAARQIRQDARAGRIPMIALTAHALQEDRMRAEAEGFDSYLAKPIEPRRVIAEVRRLLEGGGGDGASAARR